MKNWVFNDESAPSPDAKAARNRATLLSLPLAVMGIFALVLLAHDGLLPLLGPNPHWGLEQKKTFVLLAAVVASICFIALFFSHAAKKQSLKISLPKPADDTKPWLKRADWSSGRITSGSKKSVLLIWIFAIFWNAVSAPILLVALPAEWHKGNHAILIALLFPVIGLGMIFYAASAAFAWRKFGQSIFEMAALPASPGGTLEGEIQVKTRLQPQHGLHLRLSCILHTTTGSGKDRHTSEKILWQDEKWLRADLPQTDVDATGIPVYFKLPGDQPESITGSGDGVHWKLEASARLRGPNFHTTFDVPVFKLPATPEIADDPTLPYQMSLEEIREQIHSRIQVNDTDGGKEFIFPAARNPVFASAMTFFALIFIGATACLLHFHAPILFPIVFTPISLLLAGLAFNVWFLRSRVLVTPQQVTVQKSWLGIKTERTIAAADITAFSAQAGATAGHQTYYDLKILTGDDFATRKAKFLQTGQAPPMKFSGGDVTAGSNIGDKPEADWLVRQMTAALKKSS